MYTEDQLLPLSGLQHIHFCERQCALIHVEQVWLENRFTAEGRSMHDRVDSGKSELRREQYRQADSKEISAQIAYSVLTGKLANSRTVLQRTVRDHGGKVDAYPPFVWR